MSAYGPLIPDGGRHGAPFGRELLVHLRLALKAIQTRFQSSGIDCAAADRRLIGELQY